MIIESGNVCLLGQGHRRGGSECLTPHLTGERHSGTYRDAATRLDKLVGVCQGKISAVTHRTLGESVDRKVGNRVHEVHSNAGAKVIAAAFNGTVKIPQPNSKV